MALTGINFCKPTVVDTKKQNSRPIFQPLRLLSSSASTMHQTKTHDFPFVSLTGHKLVDDRCIPPSFDIMDDHTNFEEDFGFVKNNNFTNARAIFKNASFKGCHQFPMISISQLVGGFVGSKSQVRAKNREPHQIWDIVFQKLDEFVNSRPVERYSEHCYEFQTLSQNLIGSLYEESGSALGLAASYILADSGKSFKNTNPTSNIAKSSPIQQSVEIIPPPVNTFVSHSSVLPSHSPSNPSTVPVNIHFVDHLISQSDLPHRDPILPDPVRFACVDHLVSTSSTLEPSPVNNILAEQPPNKDPILEKPLPISSEVKQSYAEVAKMAHGRSPMDGDHRHTRMKSSSKRYRKVDNHYFVRGCNDSRQRCIDSSNWRDQGAVSSERKDLRRNHFTPAHLGWKCEGKSESIPKRISQSQWRKNGLNHMKPCIALKTVPEFTPSPAGEVVNRADSPSSRGQSSPTVRDNSCQFYNPNKRSCANWRCRQHSQKSSAKHNVRYILAGDNVVRNNPDDGQTPNSDVSPSPNENGDIRINNTFESYITMPPMVRTSPDNCDGSTVATRVRSNSIKSSLQSLPNSEFTVANLRPIDLAARPRSLSETADRIFEPPHAGKERSSSESTESVPARSRTVSEVDSKTNSASSSSLLSSSSSSSCKLVQIAEANLRRRFSSECDSEDSFVIFEGGGVECTDYDSDSDDGDSDSSTDYSCDVDSDEDEVDASCPRVSLVFCVPCDENPENSERLRELNERWEASQRGDTPGEKSVAPCKKAVSFAPDPCLATVHRMVHWDFAYRSARCGPWEEMARDRERFRQRVERSEPTLTAVLGAAHRREVLQCREAAGRHDIPPPLVGPEQTARKWTTLVRGCDAF